MKKIYEHIEFARVGYYQSILDEAGIETHLKHLGSSMALGEVPFTHCYPELWVLKDGDYERALEVLKPYHEEKLEVASDWNCSTCGETIEGSFGQCWSCQTMRETE